MSELDSYTFCLAGSQHLFRPKELVYIEESAKYLYIYTAISGSQARISLI